MDCPYPLGAKAELLDPRGSLRRPEPTEHPPVQCSRASPTPSLLLHPKRLNPNTLTLNPKPLNPKTLNPKALEPQTLNPYPEAQSPESPGAVRTRVAWLTWALLVRFLRSCAVLVDVHLRGKTCHVCTLLSRGAPKVLGAHPYAKGILIVSEVCSLRGMAPCAIWWRWPLTCCRCVMCVSVVDPRVTRLPCLRACIPCLVSWRGIAMRRALDR